MDSRLRGNDSICCHANESWHPGFFILVASLRWHDSGIT